MDNDDHSAPPSPYPLVMAWPAGWRGCSSVFFLLSNLLELNLEGYLAILLEMLLETHSLPTLAQVSLSLLGESTATVNKTRDI